jgi:pyruvate/2-oxoglutarate dehydrogenase complex dihydrolipoamide acyltransferase (E2) component
MHHPASIHDSRDGNSSLPPPPLPQVEGKGIVQIAQELAQLQQLAAAGKLEVKHVTGGTMTISNIGGGPAAAAAARTRTEGAEASWLRVLHCSVWRSAAVRQPTPDGARHATPRPCAARDCRHAGRQQRHPAGQPP